MKRIGILSDTHSTWDDRYAVHFKDCDEIWHAGDIGDIDLLLRLQAIGPMVRAVRGNIDHGDVARVCPELLQFEVEGVHVVLTHIGGYPGHYTSGMYALLRRTRPQLMVDGHSHILRVMYDKSLGVLHICCISIPAPPARRDGSRYVHWYASPSTASTSATCRSSN